MLKSQRNKLYMYLAVRDVCNDHEVSWSSVPAFAEAFTAFSDKVTRIVDEGRSQLTVGRGVRHQRETLLEEASTITLQCANALRSFALNSNNTLLADAIQFNKSDIVHSTLNNAVQIIGFVEEKVEEHATALEAYGITQAKRQVLADKFAELEAVINAPRSAIILRKGITSKIARLVHEADLLLEEQIDRLMEVIKSDAADFYTQYSNARKVLNLGVRHKQEDNDDRTKTNEDGAGNE